MKDKSRYNEYLRKYVGKRYYVRKMANIEYLGGQCVSCGSTERLEFDHIDPSTKSYNIGKMWSLSQAKLVSELDKCQLLCYDCHRVKTYGCV
jgi:5-methylcytosine-specific restriction endonuclease McrA